MTIPDLVLSRFPRHLDVDDAGKIMREVVTAAATGLEAEIVQVGRIRQARRLGELDELADLGRLVALHGAGIGVLDALNRRVRALEPAALYDTWIDVARHMVADLIALQREESGTVTGLLGATAAYLGLAVADLDHDRGGYWHLARCPDRLVPGTLEEPNEWLLALEENPPRLADLGPSPFHHRARFSVMRQGFDQVPATVIVQGIDDRTMHPMVVNVDDGFGVAATFPVLDGAVLRFERDGRVELDGSSVARNCFTFTGAVFADVAADHRNDFVFADASDPFDPAAERPTDARGGVFAVTQPLDDAFDPAPSFPHGDGLLPAVQLDRRETRFAVFTGAGTFATSTPGTGDEVGTTTIIEAAPHPIAGFFDETVFEPDAPPTGSASFEIGFEWDEREAYAVKIWLPLEYQDLDEDNENPLTDVVRGLLDRHRAAGVHVYVDYADPRWILGTGVVRDLESEAALGVAVAGTETWEDEIEQPGGNS